MIWSNKARERDNSGNSYGFLFANYINAIFNALILIRLPCFNCQVINSLPKYPLTGYWKICTARLLPFSCYLYPILCICPPSKSLLFTFLPILFTFNTIHSRLSSPIILPYSSDLYLFYSSSLSLGFLHSSLPLSCRKLFENSPPISSHWSGKTFLR